MILREWNFSNRDQPTLTFPFDLRNRLFETVVDSGYPVAQSWEKRGTKVSRWIWNSHFVSSLFPSLCTPNPTQSFPFNPNVSTFSSRGRIQRDWNHDSLALPFYLLMPSSEWRPSRDDRYSESGTRGSLASLAREREFDRGFEAGNNGAFSSRLSRGTGYPWREREHASQATLSRSGY